MGPPRTQTKHHKEDGRVTIREREYPDHAAADEQQTKELDVQTHRRILDFVNKALTPEDLVRPPRPQRAHDHGVEHDAHEKEEEEPVIDAKTATRLLSHRDAHFPYGFRHARELLEARLISPALLERIRVWFGYRFYGRWDTFAQPIPRRGPGSYDGVIHAAVLHTGKVLFITADETTLLWDPEDATAATFSDPVNQPHTMPGGYSQLCGHHVFLSNGKLLSVGGGGYGHNSLARWGYKFDPVAESWERTAGAMSESRWYPTAVALGDHRVLVVCGHGSGQMDIYDEATDTFTEVTAGDNKPFPELYPGLHLLPNHAILYTRAGWGSAGAGGGPHSGPSDDQSAYLHVTGANTVAWTNIAATTSRPDRTKGMSVLLLGSTPPYVRVMVLGGADSNTNNTYEIIDATSLSPAANWDTVTQFPDCEHRSLASAVVLPDGNVFVCGGIQRTNSPCTMFNASSNSWSAMAALPSIRDYHSVAVLLPSGKVAMAGWNNTSLEVFSPPYLFRGARPVISDAPNLVHHGQSFVIESPDADDIVKVVLVRPMAVTHQTDSEQKVLEMPMIHDHARPSELRLTAPDGGHPHSLAQQGYYMMFALNRNGVPSVARWIYLH